MSKRAIERMERMLSTEERPYYERAEGFEEYYGRSFILNLERTDLEYAKELAKRHYERVGNTICVDDLDRDEIELYFNTEQIKKYYSEERLIELFGKDAYKYLD